LGVDHTGDGADESENGGLHFIVLWRFCLRGDKRIMYWSGRR
jgi:hypothetical protein